MSYDNDDYEEDPPDYQLREINRRAAETKWNRKNTVSCIIFIIILFIILCVLTRCAGIL